MLDFVFSALEFIFTSLVYEFEGMALTPSCKGLRLDLVDWTNHIQGFTHVNAPKLTLTHHVKRP